MKRLIKMAALIAAFAMPSVASAQDKLEPTVGIDLVSSYIWRGQNLGKASFQPVAGLSWKGVSLGAWGSYDFVDKDGTKEIDITLAYNIAGFTVGVTDYFAPADDKDARFFFFKNRQTSHVWEGNIGYDFGFLSLNWYTNFAGNDFNKKAVVDANGVPVVDEDGNPKTEEGKQAFSSYFEIAAPFKIKHTDWEAAVGFVPYKSDYYDVNKFNVTNVSLKCTYEIPCGKNFKIPVYGQVIANPASAHFYFVGGFHIGI